MDHTIRDTEAFFGRRNELSRLHTLYCENPSRIPMLFLISGQFRMGKSMITKKLQKDDPGRDKRPGDPAAS